MWETRADTFLVRVNPAWACASNTCMWEGEINKSFPHEVSFKYLAHASQHKRKTTTCLFALYGAREMENISRVPTFGDFVTISHGWRKEGIIHGGRGPTYAALSQPQYNSAFATRVLQNTCVWGGKIIGDSIYRVPECLSSVLQWFWLFKGKKITQILWWVQN